jgi:hypothetical protein
MIWPAVPEQVEVGDPLLRQEFIEEYWPFGETPAEIYGLVGPVELVAAAQVDAVHFNAVPGHLLGKTAEEWPRWSLKEKEGTTSHY